jgi:hypothetical protein
LNDNKAGRLGNYAVEMGEDSEPDVCAEIGDVEYMKDR